MSITVTKTSDLVRVVHVDDPDVTAHDSERLGWVPLDRADVRPGATALAIRAVSKRELMLADGDMSEGGINAGIAAYRLAVAGIAELGSWHGQTVRWSVVSRSESQEFIESIGAPEAVWQLGGMVRQVSGGWSVDGLDEEDATVVPLQTPPAGVGLATGG